MINPYHYASSKVNILPRSFVEDIIDELNSLQDNVNYWQNRFNKAEEYYDIKYTDKCYKHYKEKLCNVKEFLKALELYPVWSMPGHQETYYIPNHEDCNNWQIYIEEITCGEEY